MTKLTKEQQRVLNCMRAEPSPALTAHMLKTGMPTMEALQREGLVEAHYPKNIGSLFKGPHQRHSITWRLTDKGAQVPA